MAQIKEIRCLKVREVDLEHKVLHLEDSKTGAWAEEHHFFIVHVPDDMELNFCENRPEEISVAWVAHNDLLNPKITPFDDMRRFFEQYLLPKFLDF